MPHRVKKRKVQVDEEEVPTRKAVSHILDNFHKIATKPIDEPAAPLVEEEHIEEQDLGPVPQPEATRIRSIQTDGLPEYLKKPIYIDHEIPWSETGLKHIHLHETAFAVQAALIPALLKPHLVEDRSDYLVSAPTGSGKTLAYVAPILDTLFTRTITRLRALIIVPTRELVQQVYEACNVTHLKVGYTSTRPFAAEQAMFTSDEEYAKSSIDILVCTPGRLVDHLKTMSLQDLRFLVIDEGDRLLNASFQGWSETVMNAIPSSCQKLVFSATLSTDPSLLAQLRLQRPVLYMTQHAISKFTTPDTLQEIAVVAPDKPLALVNVIRQMGIESALIFTNNNESAQQLTTLLSLMIPCKAYTSTLSSTLRKRYLKQFPEIKFLVCSDLMARGIDLEVDVIINYDSAIPTRQYIHRVGRTARAGHQGRAISIVAPNQQHYFHSQTNRIIRANPIEKKELEMKYVEEYQAALASLQ